MNVLCPGCATQVPAQQVNRDIAWAKCQACRAVFPLVDVPAFPCQDGVELIERPPAAGAIFKKSEQELFIRVPVRGVRVETLFELAAATYVLIFMAAFTGLALGIFAGVPPATFRWLGILYIVLPFWLAGFGLMARAFWLSWGTKAASIDAKGMTMTQRCLFWSRRRWIERDRIQCARPYDPLVKDAKERRHGVEIIHRGGSFVLPAQNEAEERWLAGAINDFVKSLARKVFCPDCSTTVDAEYVNLDTGWARCEMCQAMFALADVMPRFPRQGTGKLIQRPLYARASVERSEQLLLIQIPAEGMRAATWGLLAFATCWLIFIAHWTNGVLGVFAVLGAGTGGPPAALAFFSIPFWLIGCGIIAKVFWLLWATKELRIDAEGMRMVKRCRFWSRSRRIGRDQVQYARPYRPVMKDSVKRQYGVEIIHERGSFVLPADTEDEERWLVAEVNDFVRSLKASQPRYSFSA
jgi:hypothetical protein